MNNREERWSRMGDVSRDPARDEKGEAPRPEIEISARDRPVSLLLYSLTLEYARVPPEAP